MKLLGSKFYHFRVFKNQNLSTTGGVTVCSIEKDGSTLVGITVCYPKDGYNKKYGRDRSQVLAMSENKFKKIESTDRSIVISVIKDMARSAWYSVIQRGSRMHELGDHKIILSSRKRKEKKKVISFIGESLIR